MKTAALIISILVLGAASASAETFKQAPYLAEAGVDVLTRDVANQMVGRDLFGAPYATAVVGNVDIYDRFPYLEARYFQIVSDPSWNRLLVGEMGQSLSAFDGEETGFGRLDSPRGLSSDGLGRVYVADTGNNRVLVFRTVTEFDNVELAPLYAIEDLAQPYDVAYSDGGTPWDDNDDRLYVANTGRNEVRLYRVGDSDAVLSHAIGDLGSGIGRFAGPTAITVGHRDGVHTGDVYVADAHNGRVVNLRDNGSTLSWAGSVDHQLGAITSLDTDHWGNVYAAAPRSGSIAKYTSTLSPVASFSENVMRPRSFHVAFANVTDHRTGAKSRAGQGSGILVEEWGGNRNGIRLLSLGVELADAAALQEEGAGASIMLTDHARVTATITNPRTGEVVARHDAGIVDAGRQTIRFDESDYVSSWEEGDYQMSIAARSTYDDAVVSEKEITISMSSAGGPALPDRVTLLGNSPNPFNPTTTIRFAIPSGPARAYNLRVYDVRGRLVRDLASGQIGSGLHQVLWNGYSNAGNPVGSGIYLYRLDVGQEKFTGKMVMVK